MHFLFCILYTHIENKYILTIVFNLFKYLDLWLLNFSEVYTKISKQHGIIL